MTDIAADNRILKAEVGFADERDLGRGLKRGDALRPATDDSHQRKLHSGNEGQRESNSMNRGPAFV